MKQLYSTFFHFILIVCTLFGIHDCNVLYQIPQDSPAAGALKKSSEVESAADTIFDVNTETAELMDADSTHDLSKLFEVDMRLDSRSHAVVFGADPRVQFGAHASVNALWPGGVVPYTLAASITSETGGATFAAIQKSIAEFKAKSCVRFLPRTTESDYIHFFKETGCWSLVGRVGGKQQISLGSGCEHKGVAMHEMMHGLGFWHEQSRPDRDSYVRIIKTNILDDRENQFKKYGKAEIDSLGFKYDYKSIMHYGSKAFSRNGLDTIAISDPSFTGKLGQREGLSTIDAQQLNALYKCNVSPVNGAWGTWSPWMTCSKQCDGGQQMRSRSCDNPQPSGGGLACIGDNIERMSCNSQPCTVECDFDAGLCAWQNAVGDNFDWTRSAGETPSSGTGPSLLGRTATDNFLFIETSSPRSQGDAARLVSSNVPSSPSERCLRFSYSMNGATTGTLKVELQSSSSTSLVWSLSGDQGQNWKTASIPIAKHGASFKILITGIRGSGFTGDIALDDIAMDSTTCSLSPSNASPSPVATVPPVVETKSTPTTPKAATSKPASSASSLDCSFETQCDWVNIDGDTFDWDIRQKKTLTRNTGPQADHTLGTASGSYVYIETSSPRLRGDTARLRSDQPITTGQVTCLGFYYHMFGRTIGTLRVLVRLETGREVGLWELTSQQGSAWNKASVPLPANVNFDVIIEGVVGRSVFGDIAIDDITWEARPCSLQPANAKIATASGTTVAPVTTQVPLGSVFVQVSSEGCQDPVVRQRTLAKLGTDTTGRVRRSSSLRGLWSHLKQKAKSVVAGLKKAYGKFKTTSSDDDSQSGTSRAATIQNDCTLARASIKVSGREYANHRAGHVVVAINGKTGRTFLRGNFNTDVSGAAGSGLAKMIRELPDDTIIVIATESTAAATSLGENELRSIGVAAPYYPADEGSWAFIGYKGSNAVNWIQQDSKAKGRGPAQVSAVIPVVSQPRTTRSLGIAKQKVFDGTSYLPIAVKFTSLFDFGKTDFTLVAWIKTSSDGTLFAKVGNGNMFDTKAKMVFLERGVVKLRLSDKFTASGSKIVTDNRWHLVVVVTKAEASPNRVSLYIDRQLQFDLPFVSTPDSPGYLGRVGYGVRYYPSPSAFVGEMRSVTYYDQAISDQKRGDIFKKGSALAR